MPEPKDDVKQDEGAVTPPEPKESEGTPSPDQEPLPGQTEPDSSETPTDGKQEVDEKTVPLAALQEERGKRQDLQAELDVLRQVAGDNVLFDMNGKPVQAAPGQGQPATEPQPNRVAEELDKLWEENPRKAVQVEIMAAQAWRDNQEAQLDQQIMAAGNKYADFGTHRATVRQYIRALPVDQRAKPGVVDLAYYVVKGQNSGNAVEQARQEILRKIQAGEQVQGLPKGTKSAPATPKGVVLNEEQLKVADAMGLTPEQYISAIKEKVK